ncbi:hypothetical protein B0H17DRAFT_1218024 [Mycena rosella]|uniref:Uncharacterized protein n=1 Tax=Mycena rosella TaxID=1033263 RepID=A0AAD7FN34_MYCRO|nr:hypothetical protein B0H17DRAFT_1218024 [Mycena rosella]
MALSEYDQVLLKARDQVHASLFPSPPPTRRSQNHMKEALVLFDSVINLHVHLLFLNKMDVFKTKLLKIPLLPRCPCSYITTFKTPFVLPSKRPSHRCPQRAADGAPKLMAAMAPLGHQERTFEKHFEPPGVRPCHRRPKRTVVVTPSFMALSEESDTKLGADAPGALRVPLGCDE